MLHTYEECFTLLSFSPPSCNLTIKKDVLTHNYVRFVSFDNLVPAASRRHAMDIEVGPTKKPTTTKDHETHFNVKNIKSYGQTYQTLWLL